MEKMIKLRSNIFFCLLLSILFSGSRAQEYDTTKMVDTSLIPGDTTELKPWEIMYADTILADTVTKKPQFNLLDSLRLYLLSDRFDLTDVVIRSYGHDAGDFVNSNPSNFSVDYQPIPLRKTVAPYALPGNRMDVILGDRALHPIEHLPEPDNQIGFDDVPTAPVQKTYNIEGPIGKIFGGDNATSSLIMIPVRPESNRAESKLIVDVGNLGYANTKAVFTERNKSGQLLQLAAEYRRSDGFDNNWGDSSYHHWADIVYPIKGKLNLNLKGRLFRRRGNIPFRPESSQNSLLKRDRRDRDFSGGLDYSFSTNSKTGLAIRHQRSETKIDIAFLTYKSDLDIIDNSIHLFHDIIFNRYLMRHEIFLTEEEFHNTGYYLKRRRAKLNSIALYGDSIQSIAGNLSIEKVDSYDPAPSFVLAYNMGKESFYLSISAGFITKIPRQYELSLAPVTDRVINRTVNDYYESGNADLKPEKQMSGNLTMSLGRKNNDITVSLTGGKIQDGIDWIPSVLDTDGLSLTAFQTRNRDIEYANISVTKRLSLGEKLFWTGAGSYRYVNIDGNDKPSYSPDYQFITGLELYHYVRFLDTHLYGYIETGYIGPYNSYPAFGEEAVELGEKFVTNLKLSFRIKSFRFYYYWQNLLITDYQLRQNYGIRDMLVYYGFTWDFLD